MWPLKAPSTFPSSWHGPAKSHSPGRFAMMIEISFPFRANITKKMGQLFVMRIDVNVRYSDDDYNHAPCSWCRRFWTRRKFFGQSRV
jgi:hypothetical protein